MEWIIFLEYWNILYLRKFLSQIRTYTIRIHWHVYIHFPRLCWADCLTGGQNVPWGPGRNVRKWWSSKTCSPPPTLMWVFLFFFYHINIFSNFYISYIYFIFLSLFNWLRFLTVLFFQNALKSLQFEKKKTPKRCS